MSGVRTIAEWRFGLRNRKLKSWCDVAGRDFWFIIVAFVLESIIDYYRKFLAHDLASC